VPELRPFRAYRPPAERAPRVAAPPYDVVTSAEARALAAGNPDSFLHVSRPEIDLPEGTDEHDDAVYAEGRKNLLEMVEKGALVQDGEPHLYVYAQRMPLGNGKPHTQVGIVACAAVRDYVEDRIKKHEKTRPDKEDDRARHIRELEAHDEPVFLSYRANPGIDADVAELSAGAPIYDFTTDDGVGHKLWVIDAARSVVLSRRFANEVPALYVADGHHRSAAAMRVHQELRGDGREHDAFMVVAFPHDQMQILAYNRVVKDDRGRKPEALLAELGQRLDVVKTDRPVPSTTGELTLYLAGQWYRLTALPGSFDADDPVARLDCQICQDLILGPVFGIDDPRRDQRIGFVGGIHGHKELERRVDAGEATAALHLFPTRMDQVMAVSDAGLIMPPKSTWFEPKLKSGLFVHTF
jgi:uncharacterized protein (DUF1015 family)